MLEIAAFEAARSRLSGHIVETPLARLVRRPAREPGGRAIVTVPVDHPALPSTLYLKAESLQVTGSFKARGALNRVLALAPAVAARGIVTASGGNHGAAVAYAAHVVGVPSTIFLPASTPETKAARIALWGARVVRAGRVWDDAHAEALAYAADAGATYVHPFADEDVVAGQGTIALELLAQLPEVDVLVVAIGGGGLVAGVARAAKLLRPEIRVLGVEPHGAPTLERSLAAGRVVELERVTTRAGTLAPRRSDPYVFDIIREHVERVVLVSDAAMHDAARFLLANVGLGAELSGAAALAAVLSGAIDLGGAKAPCVLVCGAGDDALAPRA